MENIQEDQIRQYADRIAKETGLDPVCVVRTLRLLLSGATVPFIARYRKEATGSMDEVQIAKVEDRMKYLQDLDKRRETILKTIRSQEKLTPELERRILECGEMDLLEDLYLPFKPRRRTRAQVARERGLEPLSVLILGGKEDEARRKSAGFLSEEVKTKEEALDGALDIVAETISEHAPSRARIREYLQRHCLILTRMDKDAQSNPETPRFKTYLNYMEMIHKVPSHALLAILRAQEKEVVKVSVQPEDPDRCLKSLRSLWIKDRDKPHSLMSGAIEDAYLRLMEPSLCQERLRQAKREADEAAVGIFQGNLRQLLLEAPLGQKRVMGIDPGIRTGCKVVCLDREGGLLHFEAVYPHDRPERRVMASKALVRMAEQYKIEAIAIGNGTASRETASWVGSLRFRDPLKAFVVSEDGASIYSASALAREEFPDQDVTVRGAVSIGRRLMDPLSELVKIEPKNLGVGQYQHDVDQTLLKECLDRTVVSCVNQVGVNLNTASWTLLRYVSGLTESVARGIVRYREENGAFLSRQALRKVPRLGPVTFEQCAGFLRIPGAENPLDASQVHPESYCIVEQMAQDLGCGVGDLVGNRDLLDQIVKERYVTDKVGLPTIEDVLTELSKPGRDPRLAAQVLEFDETVSSINDLREGMILPGIVTNITAFGAFVDVGVHQDGLVHVSEMADRYVRNPQEVLKLHQHVMARVIKVDQQRGRISLSLRNVSKN